MFLRLRLDGLAVAADPLHPEVRRDQAVVALKIDLQLIVFLDAGQHVAFLVEDVERDAGRHPDRDFGRTLAHRLFLDDPQHL